MGISIKLYQVSDKEKLTTVQDIESQIAEAAATSVDLYKMGQDIVTVLTNKANPYADTSATPCKMVYGNKVEVSYDDTSSSPFKIVYGDNLEIFTDDPEFIGGFLPSSEIKSIGQWITESRVDNKADFLEAYKNLSEEVKVALDDMGSPGAKELYDGYIEPLSAFYFSAEKNNAAVIFCGE